MDIGMTISLCLFRLASPVSLVTIAIQSYPLSWWPRQTPYPGLRTVPAVSSLARVVCGATLAISWRDTEPFRERGE